MAISALDPSITENFYGFIIAAYSLGQIISAPLVGFWSTKIRAVRLPIQIVLLSVLAGNLVVSSTFKWLLIFQYFFAALLPTGRKYAVLLARFLVGVGGGPALQLIFTPIGPKGLRIHGDLRLNMYTTPALACCFVNLMAMCLLQFFFVEKYATNVMDTNSEEKTSSPEYDRVAVSLCHFTRFTQLFTWTNLETCDFRLICVFGLIGFVLFHFVTFSWPFSDGHIQTYSEKDAEEPRGCPKDRFDWCINFTPINVWVYFVSFAITLGACWAQINVTLSTILSNVLGQRKQQNQQSIFYAVGSSARLTGPIFIRWWFFFLIFFAYNSAVFVAEVVINGLAESGKVDHHAGYRSYAILYAAFALSNPLAASIVRFFGSRRTMAIGFIFYATFQLNFVFLHESILYVTAALLGLAAGQVWSAQGTYLAWNSTEKTAGRHANAFPVSTLRLCTKPRMIFVIFCFLYIGLELAFNESIYPTSVAFTLRFGGNTKQLLALNMIAEGFGQIRSYFSGLASNRLKRDTIALFGFLTHLFVYVGIFINFPGNSSLFRTNETSRFFDHPQIWLALLCGYLLGFGDAIWHTQLMAHLIAFHKDESAQSFAIFRFFEVFNNRIQ
ncbi:hypothetical protein M3Y94_00679800 [Aphelenchoides besseyi]|nr:hypothetical protein M3Y94_00679800 [Aphelenchoides besseyi]